MNAHKATNQAWSFARTTAFVAALLGVGACDDLPDPIDVEIPNETINVFSSVRPPFAGIGDQVLVTIDFVGYPTDGTQQRAHVAWDPASFEYVQTMPPESNRYLDQNMRSGSMTLEADLTVAAPKSRITVLFRALVNTSTSGITVYSHAPPTLP